MRLLFLFFFFALVPGVDLVEAEQIAIPTPETQVLQGRWVRTDAPYIIELNPTAEGSLQAQYYNPKSIHVSKTETVVQDGVMHVLVKLQDVNYPGSTYILAYDHQLNILKGLYYHPATNQRYKVEFVRQDPK